MPIIIYYSRAIHRCPQNTRGTCHMSTNVSWSWSTLKSKKSKNRNCMIWLPPSPASGVTRDHWDMSHTPGPILQLKKRQGPPVFHPLNFNFCIGKKLELRTIIMIRRINTSWFIHNFNKLSINFHVMIQNYSLSISKMMLLILLKQSWQIMWKFYINEFRKQRRF